MRGSERRLIRLSESEGFVLAVGVVTPSLISCLVPSNREFFRESPSTGL
jgi:hypothetical protein